MRAETEDDAEAIHVVNRRAFGQDAEARLVDVIRMSTGFIPELSLVAESDGKIVGHILFSRIEVQGDGGITPVLALAPLAVLPPHQDQGIGSALVREGLLRARQLGHHIVVVVGRPEFYQRFGFASARDKGLECPFPVPEDAFMALELELNALEGVSGAVVYPPAFDEA